jgi:NAD(P)-dependent dehydrogenase (short-subunit alcohol dehydrogenase family)
MASRTWLISGVSSGFGSQLSEQLLEHGDRVAGTIRDTTGLAAMIAGIGT